jgi:pimeloyl-ACP methyl ester carboxylesterase
MRARHPDREGFAEARGIRLFFEAYGEGDRTVLLIPPWQTAHSRIWKAQIPYLARSFRVVTYDNAGTAYRVDSE